jgi:hypothetical protein
MVVGTNIFSITNLPNKAVILNNFLFRIFTQNTLKAILFSNLETIRLSSLIKGAQFFSFEKHVKFKRCFLFRNVKGGQNNYTVLIKRISKVDHVLYEFGIGSSPSPLR